MVDIAVNAMEAENAPCRPLKLETVKVMVNKEDFQEFQEYDEAVTVEDARKVFPDMEAFWKRNRFSEKNAYYLVEKIKNDEDREALRPYFTKIYNRWVDLTKLSDEDRQKVLSNCSKTDTINSWERLSFEEMESTCASCPLAWNKGKDCIGTFGPVTSKLPEIAQKYGCMIIASAIESAESGKMFTPEDAETLLKEAQTLKPVLIDEGKMAAHRYSGPVERLEMIATACVKEKCGFFFI